MAAYKPAMVQALATYFYFSYPAPMAAEGVRAD
jgi:hypothetical protein